MLWYNEIYTWTVSGIDITRADCHEEDTFLFVQGVVMSYGHVDSRLADGIGSGHVNLCLVDEIGGTQSGR